MRIKIIILLFFFFTTVNSQSLYFPPAVGNTWDTVSPSSLGWCEDELDTLIDYLGQYGTKAFIVLKDGKIAVEQYYGTFTQDSLWYWASAGKSLTAFLIGLAQEQGYLNIYDSLPAYLGHGFSSCGTAAEDSMKIIHQLTMTTGFDDMYGGVTVENHCTDDSCLVCIAPPGTRWAYHNAPYTMTHWLFQPATGMTANAYKTQQLSGCGITGLFFQSGYDDVYFSKPRSFARFGLLMLANGIWNGDTIMHDTAYFNNMINTSQNINLAYGYLWWLNGKASYHLPNTQIQIPGPLSPHAPADMYSALGKNEQILNVVPSMNLVMIRMGDAFSIPLEVANVVNDSIWIRFNEVLCSTSISENNKTGKLYIYPDPAVNSFSFDLPSESDLTILSVNGDEVFKNRSAKGKNTIDCSGFVPGIYFVTAAGKNSLLKGKLIISR